MKVTNMNESDFETSSGALVDQFLIAMPHLQDPNFNQTVTYLWQHNAEGALGIVINKASYMRLPELFDALHIDMDEPRHDSVLQNQHVMTGGPVEENKGFILHSSEKQWEHTIAITPELSLSMSKDILVDIAAGTGPQRYLVALGCAGWDAGQLEEEIANNVWLTVPAVPEIIFSTDHAGKAEACAALIGISLDQLSSTAGHS